MVHCLAGVIGKKEIALVINHHNAVQNGIENRFDLGFFIDDLFHLHVVVDLELLGHLIKRLDPGL